MFDQTLQPTVLKVKQEFAARSEQVYRAWTEPTMLLQWFRAAPGMQTTIAEVDLRVGGAYRLGMLNPKSKEEHIAVGEYQRIEPGKQLVFTWAWVGMEENQTLVTVDFLPRGDRTEVVLTHKNFQSEEDRDSHVDGWQGCFAGLGEYLDGVGQ